MCHIIFYRGKKLRALQHCLSPTPSQKLPNQDRSDPKCFTVPQSAAENLSEGLRTFGTTCIIFITDKFFVFLAPGQASNSGQEFSIRAFLGKNHLYHFRQGAFPGNERLLEIFYRLEFAEYYYVKFPLRAIKSAHEYR